MSILSQAIAEFKAGKSIVQIVEDAGSAIEVWGENLIKRAESDPAIGGAVTTAVDDAKAVVADAVSWIDTAAATQLANFGDEVAGLVVKYGAALAGTNPTIAGVTTLIGALVNAGVATVHHEALALQNQLVPPSPTPPVS